jgi:hypothetical protein
MFGLQVPLSYRSDILLQAWSVFELLVDTTPWYRSPSELQVGYPVSGSECPELLVDTTLWDLSASDLLVGYPASGSECPWTTGEYHALGSESLWATDRISCFRLWEPLTYRWITCFVLQVPLSYRSDILLRTLSDVSKQWDGVYLQGSIIVGSWQCLHK